MLQRQEIKEKSKKNLKQNFWPIFFTLLILSIIPIGVAIAQELVVGPLDLEIEKLSEIIANENFSATYRQEVIAQLTSVSIAKGIWSVVFTLAELYVMCFELSICAMFMVTAHGEKYEFKDFKEFFIKIKESFCLNLLVSVKVFLWSLLFIIPGIIKLYAYSMANHIRLEEPELSAKECIKKSEELMKNRKMELFELQLSFIGWRVLALVITGFITTIISVDVALTPSVSPVWFILSMVICTIIGEVLMIPVSAYMGVAEAEFFLVITREEENKKRANYVYDNSAYREYLKQQEEKSMFDIIDGRDDFYKTYTTDEKVEPFGDFEEKPFESFSDETENFATDKVDNE